MLTYLNICITYLLRTSSVCLTHRSSTRYFLWMRKMLDLLAVCQRIPPYYSVFVTCLKLISKHTQRIPTYLLNFSYVGIRWCYTSKCDRALKALSHYNVLANVCRRMKDISSTLAYADIEIKNQRKPLSELLQSVC